MPAPRSRRAGRSDPFTHLGSSHDAFFHPAQLDVETVRIAKLMRFAPARIDGHAVPTMATMPVSFSYAEPEPFPAAEPPSD